MHYFKSVKEKEFDNTTMSKSVLITGGNRGIGFEFARQFLEEDILKFDIIIVACRNPLVAKNLNVSKEKYPTRLFIIKFDVIEWDKYNSLLEEVENIVGVENGLTVLINNAGILPEKEELQVIDSETMINAFKVNSIAPILLSKLFLPLLRTVSNKFDLCRAY